MRSHNRTVLIALCMLVLPAMLRAQEDNEPIINPEAMDALRKMGEYLRTLQKFQITGVVTNDQVLPDSQKIQITKYVDLVASRPNRLRVLVKADQYERQLIFDGTTFTLFAPRKNMYSSISAPGTINDLATLIEEKHAIELPLIDMFRWGTSEEQRAEITAAKDVGESVCDGVTCHHYAFRQPGLDWEVWIQEGDQPLPRKLVIIDRTDPLRPMYSARLQWELNPALDPAVFTFAPGPDAIAIQMASAQGAGQ